jgi:hypothetical protein
VEWRLARLPTIPRDVNLNVAILKLEFQTMEERGLKRGAEEEAEGADFRQTKLLSSDTSSTQCARHQWSFQAGPTNTEILKGTLKL